MDSLIKAKEMHDRIVAWWDCLGRDALVGRNTWIEGDGYKVYVRRQFTSMVPLREYHLCIANIEIMPMGESTFSHLLDLLEQSFTKIQVEMCQVRLDAYLERRGYVGTWVSRFFYANSQEKAA